MKRVIQRHALTSILFGCLILVFSGNIMAQKMEPCTEGSTKNPGNGESFDCVNGRWVKNWRYSSGRTNPINPNGGTGGGTGGGNGGGNGGGSGGGNGGGT
jgi:hypothetical protein